jgi:hypothetical protein
MLRFNSPEGKLVFKEAMAAGHLEGCYWDLAENFNTQGERRDKITLYSTPTMFHGRPVQFLCFPFIILAT